MIEWNTVTWYSKIAAVVVFVATFALGGYLGTEYQKISDRSIISDQAAKIAILSRTKPATSTVSGGVTLSAPKDGVSLCRGNKINVGWVASSTVDQVIVSLDAPMPANPFGEYPSTWNDSGVKYMGTLPWTVGTFVVNNKTYDLPDGDNYRVHIDAMSHGTKVGSADSGIFSIQTCQG